MEATQNATFTSWSALADDLTSVIERTGASIVAVNARPRMASSGVCRREGVVVTAAHTVKRDEDVTVTLPDGNTVPVHHKFAPR